MNDKKSSGAAGLGLPSVLTIVFVVLKMVGVINWSWVWVLAPTWISLGITIVVVLIALIIALINKR